MKKNVVALILAGGRSNRFWPLGWSKPLVTFCGKTVLEHTCLRLGSIGIEKVVIVANPDDEPEIKSIKIPGMSVVTCVQNQTDGMAGAVLAARDVIADAPCLILGPDIVEQSLLKDISEFIGNEKPFIIGKKVESYFDGGYLEFSGTKVTGIKEKPGQGNEPSSFVYLVLNFFPNISEFCLLLERSQSDRDDRYEKALSVYLGEHPAEMLSYSGYWQPIKYPWHTLDYMNYFLHDVKNGGTKPAVIKQNVTIEGQVFFGDGVKIYENTKIVGPCYIGKNVVVGNNCLIRESQIGDNCVIGFNSDITRSYLGKNIWLHSNYIGDSVISDNVSFGSGTVLANLRLDEAEIGSFIKDVRVNTYRTKLGALIGENVRIGVQSSIMPGVKIGSGSFIGAGVVLEKDLPDGSFCMINQGSYTVTNNRKTISGKDRDSFKTLLK